MLPLIIKAWHSLGPNSPNISSWSQTSGSEPVKLDHEQGTVEVSRLIEAMDGDKKNIKDPLSDKLEPVGGLNDASSKNGLTAETVKQVWNMSFTCLSFKQAQGNTSNATLSHWKLSRSKILLSKHVIVLFLVLLTVVCVSLRTCVVHIWGQFRSWKPSTLQTVHIVFIHTWCKKETLFRQQNWLHMKYTWKRRQLTDIIIENVTGSVFFSCMVQWKCFFITISKYAKQIVAHNDASVTSVWTWTCMLVYQHMWKVCWKYKREPIC